jgi:hypothetical protein
VDPSSRSFSHIESFDANTTIIIIEMTYDKGSLETAASAALIFVLAILCSLAQFGNNLVRGKVFDCSDGTSPQKTTDRSYRERKKGNEGMLDFCLGITHPTT